MAKKERPSHSRGENPYLKGDVALAKSREKRLKQIGLYLTEELNRLDPGTKYTVEHESMPKIYSGKPLIGGFPVSPKHDPDYFAFYLVSNKDGEKAEIMRIPPNMADKPTKSIKTTTAYSRLEHILPQTIKAFQSESPKKVKRGNTSGLEVSLVVLAGIGILGAIFFLSPNLTGNTIADLTTKTSSIIGAGLFIVGIVGSYFWFKKR